MTHIISIQVHSQIIALHTTNEEISKAINAIWSSFIVQQETRKIIKIKQSTNVPNYDDIISKEFREQVEYTNEQLTSHNKYNKGTYNFLEHKGSITISNKLDEKLTGIRNFLLIVSGIYLLKEGALLMHGCGIKREEKGYLFSGVAGSGKTTIAKKSQGQLLSDECVGISIEENKPVLFSTPFQGDLPATKPIIVKQEALIILDKNKPLNISPLTTKEVFYNLIQHNFLGMIFEKKSPHIFSLLIALASSLAKAIKGYTLTSKKEDDIWQVIE